MTAQELELVAIMCDAGGELEVTSLGLLEFSSRLGPTPHTLMQGAIMLQHLCTSMARCEKSVDSCVCDYLQATRFR